MGIIKTCSEYLGESAWGDMMRRSSGETIREEDDLNDYDSMEFFNYLKDHYPALSNKPFDIMYFDFDGAEEIIISHKGTDISKYFDSGNDFQIKYDMKVKPRTLDAEVHGGWDTYHNIMDAIKPSKLFATRTEPNSQDFKVFSRDGGKPDNNLFNKFVDCLINNYKG